MRFRAIVAIVAVGTLGVALTSCSDPFAPDTPDIGIELDVRAPAGGQSLAFPLTLSVELASRTYRLVVDSAVGSSHLDIHATSDGTLPVRVDLTDANGDTLGTSAFSQQFRTNSSNWILGTVAADPPLGSCLWNPAYAKGTPVADSISFYVEYGGLEKGSYC